MDLLFRTVLNMSISASWLVLAVVALRFLLKKSPRWIHVCLWALVAVRLLCPFSIESVFSLIPSQETLPKEIIFAHAPAIDSGVEIIDEAVNTTVMTSLTPDVTASVNPIQVLLFLGEWIWKGGVVLMLLWALISYLRLKRKVNASIYLDNGVCLCDYIDTPFILGILRPKIYLPSAMEPESASHVLAHERAHISRKDHWWKPLGYVLLTLHWFNPLMWLAYILLCRDIELACDEKVVRSMQLPERKSYSDALLQCSVRRMHVAACPLAFGEVGVKERVKTVLNYRKPAFWLVLVALIALVVTAVCFLTDPVEQVDVSNFFLNHVYEQEKDRRTMDEIHFLGAEDGFAAVYCSGMGSFVKFYQYEIVDGQPQIIASCGGEYNISGCISVNHVEAAGKHIYYGTVYGSHYDPAEPMAEKFQWKTLHITDANGKGREINMEGALGYLVALDAPLADFQVVSSDDTVILDYAAYTAQGYSIRENQLIQVSTPTTFFGETYRVDQVVYRNPVLSYYKTEDEVPSFQFTADGEMLRKNDTGEWVNLGAMHEIELTEESLAALFFGQKLGMEEGVTLAQLWEDNRGAWLVPAPSSSNSGSSEFYLLLWQHSGEVYLGEGISFSNVYPLHEKPLDSTSNVNWLYRLTPYSGESPYQWTSTADTRVIRKAWASPYGQATYNITIEGSRLEEFVKILNAVNEGEVSVRKPSGAEDPLWNYDGTHVTMYQKDGSSIRLRYVADTVIIDTDSGLWETDGYWVIENDALTQWMEKLSNGGTYMLSDANRDEIRQLVRQEEVQFFCPQEYGEYLFVGCAYDGGRGLGVACFEKVAYGYKLARLLREEEVKQCASGSELYYCDFNNLRLFLVLNDSVSGIEFAGGYEARCAIDTHPGLVVEYYPAFMVSVYRFLYGEGNAATMYMDWNNETFGQPPEYDVANVDNPDDAHSFCSTLKLSQIHYILATEILEVEERYSQAYAYQLSDEQTAKLLNLLREVPEEAYEQAECPQVDTRYMSIALTNDSALIGAYPVLYLKIHQGELYYQLHTDAENASQCWKIHAPELLAYLESFYEGDISTWIRFAPMVKVAGDVIWSADGVEITVPKVNCFEYDVSAEGIRFKPKGQSGWVLLQYRTEPYAADELGLRTFGGSYSGREVIRGCYGDADEWDYMDITFSSEDIYVLLLNEEGATWVAEYADEINTIIWELNIQTED